MTKTPRLSLWFAATAVIFFARAAIFSTWQSRGPEVQELLHLDKPAMGWLVMLYPVGGLIGVFFASELTRRFGSKVLTVSGFAVTAVGMAALGLSVTAGNVWLSALLLVIMGLPMAISDFVGNFEGAGVNRASPRSLMPAIHGAFGAGMVLASWVASAFIAGHVSLITNYLIIAAAALLPSIWAALNFPAHKPTPNTVAQRREHARLGRAVWREKHTVAIALIGFTFILGEISFGTWMPIALTSSGFAPAVAAAAFGAFWIVITLLRFVGGAIVDKFGRPMTVLISSLINATGVAVFMLDPILHMPFVGIALWAIGLALGAPVAVTALSDDPARAAARVNMFITVVYLASCTAGPALGFVSKFTGLYFAFVIPLAFLVASAFLSRATKPQLAS